MTLRGFILTPLDVPIPYASVYLLDASFDDLGYGVSANAQGYFNFTVPDTLAASYMGVSSVGYQTAKIPASNIYQNMIIHLQPNVIELPPVVISSGPGDNKGAAWLLLIPLAMMLTSKTRRGGRVSGPGGAGELNINTVAIIAAGAIGVSIIRPLFEGLGLWSTQATKDLNAAATDPGSPWRPEFYKTGPAGTLILNRSSAEMLAREFHDAFGSFEDDEELIFARFRDYRTQSQLSYTADVFFQTYGKDLFTYLRGGPWWMVGGDRLSDAELNRLHEIILHLPKYFP